MATVNLSPIGNQQFFLTNGLPNNGGFLNTYIAGTSTAVATYADSLGTIQNPVSIQLGTDGRPPSEIWIVQGTAVKFVLTDSSLNPIADATYDNIAGINDVTATGSTLGIALAASSGSSLVGFLQSGTGAVATDLQTRGRKVGFDTDYDTLAHALAAVDYLYITRTNLLTATLDLSGMTNKTLCFFPTGQIKADTGLTGPLIKIGGAASNIKLFGAGTLDGNSLANNIVYITGTSSHVILADDITLKGCTTGATQNAAIWTDGTHSDIQFRNLKFRNNAASSFIHWNAAGATITGLVIDGFDRDASNTGGTKGDAINIACQVSNFSITRIRARLEDLINAVGVGLDDALGAIIYDGIISDIRIEGAASTDVNTAGLVLSKVNNVSATNMSFKNLGHNAVEVSESVAGGNTNLSISNFSCANVGITSGYSAVSIANCKGVVITGFSSDGTSTAPTRHINIADAFDCTISGFSCYAGVVGINMGGSSQTSRNTISSGRLYGGVGDGIYLGGTNGLYNNFSDIEINAYATAGKYPINCAAGTIDNYFESIVLRGNLNAPTDAGANALRYAVTRPLTLTANSTTPSIAGATVFNTANTLATGITNFTNGWRGQEFAVLITDANTTIKFSSGNIHGNGGVDWAATNGSNMKCTYDGSHYYCLIGTA